MLLRHIWHATVDGQQSFGELQNQTPVTVRLDIRNTGDLVGYVRVINYVTRIIRVGERLPQRPIYNEPHGGHVRIELADAEIRIGRTLTVPLSDGRILSTQEIENIRSGTHRLYFVGTIEYWWGGDSDSLRQTAYCRYLSTNDRFEIDKDPDSVRGLSHQQHPAAPSGLFCVGLLRWADMMASRGKCCGSDAASLA